MAVRQRGGRQRERETKARERKRERFRLIQSFLSVSLLAEAWHSVESQRQQRRGHLNAAYLSPRRHTDVHRPVKT